jgi:broad specificity phosphatase PhoE
VKREDQKWPDVLWIVRHGESAGNVARDAAQSARLPVIDIATRDPDVPLSELGVHQAQAVGRWFARLRPQERQIVEMRMQGFSNDEIAAKLGIYDRKIRRVIERVRALAEQEGLSPGQAGGT